MKGVDVSFVASQVDPLLIIFGEVGHNYGMALFTFDQKEGLQKISSMCLTHQIVSRVLFSPTGKEIVAAAMSAGHIFILKVILVIAFDKIFCQYILINTVYYLQ